MVVNSDTVLDSSSVFSGLGLSTLFILAFGLCFPWLVYFSLLPVEQLHCLWLAPRSGNCGVIRSLDSHRAMRDCEPVEDRFAVLRGPP